LILLLEEEIEKRKTVALAPTVPDLARDPAVEVLLDMVSTI